MGRERRRQAPRRIPDQRPRPQSCSLDRAVNSERANGRHGGGAVFKGPRCCKYAAGDASCEDDWKSNDSSNERRRNATQGRRLVEPVESVSRAHAVTVSVRTQAFSAVPAGARNE